MIYLFTLLQKLMEMPNVLFSVGDNVSTITTL